jgi:hypothetical protein
MNSKVIVEGDSATGSVVNVSSNPMYGYITLSQTRNLINANGFLEKKRVSFLLKGNIDQLQELDYKVGQELPGAIWVEESITPFRKPELDLKVAGDTGIVCTLNGDPIYRRTRYSENPKTADITIQHDNVEELRAAYKTKQSGIKANDNFDIV